MMVATLKYRLKPTKEQEVLFREFSHTARFVYNWALDRRIKHYEVWNQSLSVQELLDELKELKYSDKYNWITRTPEAVAKQVIKDLDKAYSNFFKGIASFPNFKKRSRSKFSFYQRTDKIGLRKDGTITITGVGGVKIVDCSWFPQRPKNTRVVFDNKYWYLVVSYDIEEEPEELTDKVIGIDVGIKNLAIRSDGVVVPNINKSREVIRLEKKLKRLQRQVSRKYAMNKSPEGKFIKTKNIIKLEQQIKLVYRRLTNIRTNHLHNATADIVKAKPYRVVVEDLNIKGMLKNRHLSKAITKQCFNKFFTFLNYKCRFKGIDYVKADRYYPSSKLCSCCGNKKKHLSLSERTYTCDNCGAVIDRDHNASINLEHYQPTV